MLLVEGEFLLVLLEDLEVLLGAELGFLLVLVEFGVLFGGVSGLGLLCWGFGCEFLIFLFESLDHLC